MKVSDTPAIRIAPPVKISAGVSTPLHSTLHPLQYSLQGYARSGQTPAIGVAGVLVIEAGELLKRGHVPQVELK